MMKKIVYIAAILGLSLFAQEGVEDLNQTQESVSQEMVPQVVENVEQNQTTVQEVAPQEVVPQVVENVEQNQTTVQEVTPQEVAMEDANSTALTEDANNTTVAQDENITSLEESNTLEQNQTVVSHSQFEKSFPNHIAYKFYKKGVEALKEGDYKKAYENSMNARAIYNIKKGQYGVIPLPYLAGFLKETSYTPKRFYYKIIEFKPYELRKLIIKSKLISPPIASVVIKKRSTSTDIIVKNYGDLPLDGFGITINNKKVVSYDKINPNEQKIYSYDSSETVYTISFTEEYGFAPESMNIEEEE